MKSQILFLKDALIFNSDPKAEGIITHPGMGIVLDADFVEISPAALKVIQSAKRAGGSYANFQVFKSGEKRIIGWEGSYTAFIHKDDLQIGRNDDHSFLKATKNIQVFGQLAQFQEIFS